MDSIQSGKKVSLLFMIPLVLGTMMNPLNSTMLSTALATICHSFGRNISEGPLLITPLYITATIGQPLMGRLADIYSPKKINTLGFILVLIASLVGGLAPSFGWLIASRILLGLGTSAAYPSAIALVQKRYASFGQTVPGNILGIIAVTSQVSMVLGPTLGGYLTEWFGWSGIFFINVPWVLAAMWLSTRFPSFSERAAANGNAATGNLVTAKETAAGRPGVWSRTWTRVDGLGVFIFSLFLVAFWFVLTQRLTLLTGMPLILILLGLLVFWERRQVDPFLNVRLFLLKPTLSLVYLQTLATNYILYLMLYSLPEWIEGVRHVSPSRTGLLMFPMSFVAAGSAMLISRKENLTFLNICGVISMVVACSALFILEERTPVYILIGVTLLLGLATGVNPIANQASLKIQAPSHQIGISFGLYRTFGYIGAIISGSQLKTVFRHGVSDASFHQIVWFATGSCTILTVLHLLPAVFGRKTAEA
jgi:MFS family permease